MDAHAYDLVIVGAGTGNMLPTEEVDGWRIAVVEGDRFGGTCLNTGCIPSKMLVHSADVASTVRHAGRFGVRAKWMGADWPAIRDRVFDRIDPLHERAIGHRRSQGLRVSSTTERSPARSSSRIARRFGSPRASKAAAASVFLAGGILTERF